MDRIINYLLMAGQIWMMVMIWVCADIAQTSESDSEYALRAIGVVAGFVGLMLLSYLRGKNER